MWKRVERLGSPWTEIEARWGGPILTFFNAIKRQDGAQGHYLGGWGWNCRSTEGKGREVKGAAAGGEEKKRQRCAWRKTSVSSQFWQRDSCVSLPRHQADLDSKAASITLLAV